MPEHHHRVPDSAGSSSARTNDVRISENGPVEWFDGFTWKVYRELPDGATDDTATSLVFRGSQRHDAR